MSIEVTGPDGAKLSFPDNTPEPDIVAAMDAHYASGKGVAGAPANGDARFGDSSMLAGKFLEGVPVLGAYVPKAGAAISAAANPLTGAGAPGESFGERYDKNLADELAASKRYQAEHPVLATGAHVAGGVASLLPVASTAIGAKLLGLGAKTMPGMITQGAASGAALTGADALARGEDALRGAEIGALTGGALPIVGRAIGSAVEGVRNLRRPAPVPTNTADIAGVPVRQSLGQATGDTEAIMREQMALRGADNSSEQAVARGFFDAQKGELGQAEQAVATRLNPSRSIIADNPHDAAQIVGDAIGQRGTQQAAALTARDAATVAEREGLRTSLSPTNSVLASHPLEAGNIAGGAVANAAERAQAATTAAYTALRELPGHAHAAAFNKTTDTIKASLNAGTEPVRISQQSTPIAKGALDDLDDILGGIQGALGAKKPPITAAVLENTRKRLNTYYGQAIETAKASRDFSDVRAMRAIMHAFDAHVADRLASGVWVGGDAAQVLKAFKEARGLHASYRKTFTSQGAGDEVGQAVEKIIGRYEGQAAPPEQISQMLYGNGALPIKVAQRFVGMFGPQSPEVGAIKQGLFSHWVERADGVTPYTAEQVADRIHSGLRGTLAQVYLNPAERNRLAAYADRVRTEGRTVAPTDIDSAWARIASGQATTTDIVHAMNGTNATGRVVGLVQRVKSEFGPDSREFTALKQGQWFHLLENKNGPLDVGSKPAITKLDKFLNGDGRALSHVLYSADERALMSEYLALQKRITPPNGTVNYSNTSSVLGKMFRGTLDGLFAAGGVSMAGPVGLIAGVAAHKGQSIIQDAVKASKVARSLYGTPQGNAAMADLQEKLAAISAVTARGATPAVANAR